MAGIINTSPATSTGSVVSGSKVLDQEDTFMPDGETVPIAQESSTSTLSKETQQTEEPAASTHGTQTPPRKSSPADTPAAEPPTPSIRTADRGITKGFAPEDLAMQRNPMVTADSSMVDPQPAERTAEVPRDYSQHKETDFVQDQRQETSVTGWLVPPRAEEPSTAAELAPLTVETATGQSRISFEGACSSSALLHLLTPHFDCYPT